MDKCLSAGEAKLLDKRTIEFGIHELELMERAARGVENRITGLFDQSHTIVLLCGVGNNGGDALAVARMLGDRQYSVTVVLAGDEERATASWKWQKEHLCVYRELRAKDAVSEEIRRAVARADVLVDGLFGIGLSREVSGVYRELIEEADKSGAYKIAVDIASGLSADTGQVMGAAIHVDETVTFGYRKVGHVLHPGRAYSGEVHVCDIGFLSLEDAQIDGGVNILDEQCLKALPERNTSGNKGTFGKVYIRAGSAGMAGAALLCGEAAYRTGVGLVYLSSPEENRVIIQLGLPEAVYKGDSSDYLTLRTVDAALIGPGLTTGDNAVAELKHLLGAVYIPMVLDADALNIISLHDDVAHQVKKYPSPKILTPHAGEMGRLLHTTTAKVKADMVAKGLYAETTICEITSSISVFSITHFTISSTSAALDGSSPENTLFVCPSSKGCLNQNAVLISDSAT